MLLKTSKLATSVIVCAVALSACSPIKRIVTISPGSSQTSTVVKEEVFVPQAQAAPKRVVRRSSQPVRTTRVTPPRPVAVASPRISAPAPAPAPVIPAAVEVKPAKKDCSVSGTPGCPVVRSFGDEGDSGGGGGGWGG